MCGYERADRETKILVMLTAYIDDSSSDQHDRILHLAGYVHDAMTWSTFSDDWRKVLDASPGISYFKAKEAEGLNGEFRGWSRTQASLKIESLAGVISKHRPWTIEASVSRADYKRIVEPILPIELRFPYFPCYYAIILGLATYHASLAAGSPSKSLPPVHFIFDDQGIIGLESLFWYHAVRELLPASMRSCLGGTRNSRTIRISFLCRRLICWSGICEEGKSPDTKKRLDL